MILICSNIFDTVIWLSHTVVKGYFSFPWSCVPFIYIYVTLLGEKSWDCFDFFFFPCSICKIRINIYLFIFNQRLEAVSQSFCDHECQKRVFRYYTVTEWLSLEGPSGSHPVQLPCSSMQMTEKLSFHFVCPGSWGR